MRESQLPSQDVREITNVLFCDGAVVSELSSNSLPDFLGYIHVPAADGIAGCQMDKKKRDRRYKKKNDDRVKKPNGDQAPHALRPSGLRRLQSNAIAFDTLVCRNPKRRKPRPPPVYAQTVRANTSVEGSKVGEIVQPYGGRVGNDCLIRTAIVLPRLRGVEGVSRTVNEGVGRPVRVANVILAAR